MCYNVMTYVGSCAEKCTVYCQAVEKQLKICGFKRNVDVLVLYLAGLGLRSIPSLSLFRRLRYLWINNNKALKSKEKWPADYKFDKDGEMPFYMTGVCKSHTTLHKIQDLSFLKKNYCLTELYLNNNELTDISDLFYNPLAYDAGYRLYVIHSLPSVQLLDRKPVTQRERELAFPVYNCEKSCAVESIAFGKTVDTSPGTAIRHSRDTQPARRLMVPPDWEFGNHTNKVPFENPEDAVLLRAMTRSVMEFSSIDWNKIPTCQERWLKHKAEEPPEKLTIQFR
ncbi:leucine-rich repeat-containing protein 72 isoform X6 [Gallus gallus]|uniref:leucine-rich repeat-containing protein 72 isoform X6 n=1 Tax=Gallus gallus TaxID=9031 RepID=UPI001AE323DE|nr:leucine-rich repeat-containing protein 72 isoform X6 [Gallus gallus]